MPLYYIISQNSRKSTYKYIKIKVFASAKLSEQEEVIRYSYKLYSYRRSNERKHFILFQVHSSGLRFLLAEDLRIDLTGN